MIVPYSFSCIFTGCQWQRLRNAGKKATSSSSSSSFTLFSSAKLPRSCWDFFVALEAMEKLLLVFHHATGLNLFPPHRVTYCRPADRTFQTFKVIRCRNNAEKRHPVVVIIISSNIKATVCYHVTCSAGRLGSSAAHAGSGPVSDDMSSDASCAVLLATCGNMVARLWGKLPWHL